MTEGEKARLAAWSIELRTVHARLREALRAAAAAAGRDEASAMPSAGQDLLLYCHGLCTALAEHHRGEDRSLFPAIAGEHPELGDTLQKLAQDHAMIGHLIKEMQAAAERPTLAAEIAQHLAGIGAIMESHFRYEERELLPILDTLDGTRHSPGDCATN